jgi:hypothetical protein
MPEKEDNIEIKKTLLRILELTERPLKDIILKDLCDRNTELLGVPSSLLRRVVQRYFAYLKTLSPVQYLANTAQYNILPSKGTISRAKYESTRQNLVQKSEVTIQTRGLAKNCSSHPRSERDTKTMKTEVDEVASNAMSHLSIGGEDYVRGNVAGTSNHLRNSTYADPTSTHIPVGAPSTLLPRYPYMTRGASASGTPDIRSPYMTRGVAAVASFASDYHTPIENLFSIPARESRPNGTAGNPYIIHADLEHMECNNGFQVVFVPGVEHNNKKYNIIEICHQVMLDDVKSWKAVVCSERIPNEYHNCAIMITGPSLDQFSKDKEKSAAKFPEKCLKSMSARGDQIFEISKEDYRKMDYYLMLFEPVMVELDNSVFCNDTDVIKKFRKDMELDHPTQEKDKHTGSFVLWRIALRRGTQVAEDKEEPVIGGYD